MLLTKISAPQHLPSSMVNALADAVQEGLARACNIPPNELFQMVSRFEPEEVVFDPEFGGIRRSSDACMVEIVLLTGWTDDQKRGIFRHVAHGATQAGFRSDDILVALVENSRRDWSFGH